MRTLLTTMSLAVVLAASPSIAQQVSNTPSTEPRVVRVEATINAPVSEVWRVWTTSKGAEEFFAQMANIQLAIGGPYEIQFDPKDERSGTKGLKVLSYAPEEMISFQWNAPPEYPEVRKWWDMGCCSDAARKPRPDTYHRLPSGLERRAAVGRCLCTLRRRLGCLGPALAASLYRRPHRLGQGTHDVSRPEGVETLKH